MPVRKYGIYLVYPPNIDLKSEGLGRYLAEFLRAAQEREDIVFVIACPSWLQSKLTAFFLEFGIHSDKFSIISPKRQPWALTAYEFIFSLKKKSPRKRFFRRAFEKIVALLSSGVPRFSLWIAGARSAKSLLILVLIAFVSSPILLAVFFGQIFRALLQRVNLLITSSLFVTFSVTQISEFLDSLSNMLRLDSLLTHLYPLMTESEALIMADIINASDDVMAWYSPTAFWPQFNKIKAPRYMCVPDVVLSDFPVGFATSGNARMLKQFVQIENTIRGCDCFVTYSQSIKWNTLVAQYQIDPRSVHVIPHGANKLDEQILTSTEVRDSSLNFLFCRSLLQSALEKSVNPIALTNTKKKTSGFKYIFYASQVRPNKNILSLVKSYEYLLRRKYISHKLILTGHPGEISSIIEFITEKNLQYDVLFLHGLSTRELAACYKLADLAVNPSFSEGGCPFTFTEALSVGTPVVMGRISVTEEVILDENLRELMLFDPYDWEDMSDRIEWALNNLEYLLEMQLPHYNELSKRTWEKVVDEHIALLDRITQKNHPSLR
jgi:glycosyltransferase involved in cell wall biosynthesis